MNTEKENDKSINLFILFLGLLFILLFFCLFLPEIRRRIIEISGLILRRDLSLGHWDNFLSNVKYIFLSLGILLIGYSRNLFQIRTVLIPDFVKIYREKKVIRILFIIIPWIIILIIFGIGNLENPNFWFDESGQFWIAKGLNHTSSPGSPAGGVVDVFRNNATNNLDPGGFSLLLHFWSAISVQPWFLRLLPFIFFVMAMIVTSKITQIWFPEKYLFASFAGFIFLFSDLTKYYAFELRPYSLELLTAVFSVYISQIRLRVLSSKKNAFITGLILALLSTSRYTATLSVGIAFLFVVYEYLMRRNEYPVMTILGFGLPILTSWVLSLSYLFIFQRGTITPPAYLSRFMLSSGNYQEIILNPKAIMVYLPALVLLVYVLFAGSESGKRFQSYLIFLTALNFLFMILSILGITTWSFVSRWDIAVHSVLILSYIPLIQIVIERLINNRYQVVFQGVTTILIVFSALYFAEDYHYTGNNSMFNNFKDCQISENSKVLVRGNHPTIRYLFEFGPLQDQIGIYKNIETYSKNLEIEEGSLLDNQILNQYDYVLTEYHLIAKSSPLIQNLDDSNSWEVCSNRRYSSMYENLTR